MENEKLHAIFQETLIYLKEPILFEQLNDDKLVINHVITKKLRSTCNNNPDTAIKAMELLAKNIQHLDIYKTGILCKTLSDCIDITSPNNFVASFTIGMVLRNLILVDRYLLKALNYIENYDIWRNTPEEIKAWKCLDFLAEPASIVLSTNISARKKFRENKNYFSLLARLKPFTKSIDELFNIYKLADEKELIFIYPKKGLGFRVILNGVQNNFHLFTLVQNELAQKAGNILGITAPTNTDSVQIAKGIKKFDIDRKIPDSSLLNFYNWKAFYESDKQKNLYNPKYMLQGKMSPHNIPNLEGLKIVIIGDVLSPAQQWDTSEFRPLNQYLNSEAKVMEMLDRSIVVEILRKIQSATIS